MPHGRARARLRGDACQQAPPASQCPRAAEHEQEPDVILEPQHAATRSSVQ